MLGLLKFLPLALGALRHWRGNQKAHVAGASGAILSVLSGAGVDVTFTQPTQEQALSAIVTILAYVLPFIVTWIFPNREKPKPLTGREGQGGLY